MNVLKAESDKYLIEEGEDGDKFYVNLKGKLSVKKAIETEIGK